MGESSGDYLEEVLQAMGPKVILKNTKYLENLERVKRAAKESVWCQKKFSNILDGAMFVLELLILKVKNGCALVTNLNMISTRFMDKTFGGSVGTIAFNFDDMKTIFHLGWMETNLIHVLCP